MLQQEATACRWCLSRAGGVCHGEEYDNLSRTPSAAQQRRSCIARTSATSSRRCQGDNALVNTMQGMSLVAARRTLGSRTTKSSSSRIDGCKPLFLAANADTVYFLG